MSPQMIELQGPSQTIYLVEEGVVNLRSMAAFRLGQCHGLALAIAAHTGWELVAIIADDATCNHICVQRPDGFLVDISGAHNTEQVRASSAGCTITPINEGDINHLVSEKGWARPDIEAAKAFVMPVLAIARGEARQTSKMRAIHKIGAAEVKFIWEGFAWAAIYIKPINGTRWTPHGELRVPMDPVRNAFVIDFTPAEFERLVDNWIVRNAVEFSLAGPIRR